ncbi:PepSY-associated TM helix domain-containing protein [Pelagicoccus sp. SDUM812005]|uniref:PepSY-associated TM helix domain-containing protein n=1 Tax=Pelagicoccus sp. SDUM812005 TaxID=3041257 RepID=UPI00280CB3D4|nr:PepSY-associated TM helix domain-containing protein [Pelagicoccus sp. SDUM812005]MDQ8181208.1 PepSY-associated TM helix domain-containing protein [Pelagicoccus sp. SDUM812005]
MLRKTIFWIHLLSGLIAGAVIAIMSATGIAIAFEAEILDWVDHDLSKVEVPADTSAKLTIDELLARIPESYPDFKTTAFQTYPSNDKAYKFLQGRDRELYANPYTGEFAESKAGPAHHVLHTLEAWHRWLGASEGTNSTGRLITGVSNFAFLILCLTGLYLWFPRALKSRLFKKALTLNKKAKGKARDFNWHNVFGIWNLPVLVILVATAVVISFNWGHKLVFQLAGEEAPEHRDFRMLMVKAPALPEHPADAQPLPYQEIADKTIAAFPDYQLLWVNFPRPLLPAQAVQPLNVGLYLPGFFERERYTPISVDPFTGEVLQATRFEDRSPGMQARVWVRFLHTGEAFGLFGKIVATLATAASLVLVYTGFALSYRRFFG